MEQSHAERSNVPALQAPQTLGVPSQHEMMSYQAYAKTAVESQMYRGVGKEAGVMMIILAAREYGIPPCQALNKGLQIIEGNVELSARMMSALIRRGKHSIQVLENTDTKCTVKGKRRDNGDELTVTYTIDMAQKAGLIKEKGSWKKNPEDMLFARAISRLSRQLFSDVVGIGYIEGEISDSSASGEVLGHSIEIEAINVTETEENSDRLFNSIDLSEESDLNEFINVVGSHYKWDRNKTISEFVKDIPKTLDKFNEWKKKKIKEVA